jgi:hypothetical protein
MAVFEADLGWFALKETMLKAMFDHDEQEESNSARYGSYCFFRLKTVATTDKVRPLGDNI